MGCIYRRGKKYWIKYYRHGKSFIESTGSDQWEVASRILKIREGEISEGKLPSLCFERTSIDDLLADYLTDYRINRKRSLPRAERSVRFLMKEFRGMRMTEFSTASIMRYTEKRLSLGLKNATVNRELSAIKRAFNLGYRCTPPRVAQVPYIPMLRENNVRKGFFEHQDYVALRAVLPGHLKAVLTFGYCTGWRKGEILGLKWNQVDLQEGTVRLEPGETKNNEGRTLYLEPELLQLLKALHQVRKRDCPFVFQRRGEPIGQFLKSWDTSCAAIGRPGLLFHDLRRSAVRNMVRAGIPERVAMTISGHKTRCVFDRYNIVSQDDLREAAQKRQLFNNLQERRLQNSYILPVLDEKPPRGASGILRLVSVRRDDPPQSQKPKGSADTRSANP